MSVFTTSTGTRLHIGPAMRYTVQFVSRNPDLPLARVAKAVGPHGSNAFGTRTVNRCLAAGLLTRETTPGFRFAPVRLSPAGEELLTAINAGSF